MTSGKNLYRKQIAFGMVLLFIVLTLAAARPTQVSAATRKLSRYKVTVKSGYLALRSSKSFNYSNEIGKLYKGDTVIHCPIKSENSSYYYVYSPKLNKLGYVNRKYLKYYKKYTGDVNYYAKVKKGYLALRNAKYFDASNETGKMYTGHDVIVLHKSHTNYWTVYSVDLKRAGYTNKHYLRRK